jgi:hypothetical protein
MKRKAVDHPARKLRSVTTGPEVQEGNPGEIVARPDGYHWIAPDGRQEFGPFETLELAQADRDACEEDAPESAATMQEVEAEIGVSDWIDAETGEPAEGPCPPHLGDE